MPSLNDNVCYKINYLAAMITNNFETGKNKQSVYATVCNLFEIDWGYGYLIIKFRHLMTHLLNFFM